MSWYSLDGRRDSSSGSSSSGWESASRTSPLSRVRSSDHFSSPNNGSSSSGWESASSISPLSRVRSSDHFSSPNTSFTEYSSPDSSMCTSDLSSVDWFKSPESHGSLLSRVSTGNMTSTSNGLDVAETKQTELMQSYQHIPYHPQMVNTYSSESCTSFSSPSASSCSTSPNTSQYEHPLSPATLNDLGNFFESIGENQQQESNNNLYCSDSHQHQRYSTTATQPCQSTQQGVSNYDGSDFYFQQQQQQQYSGYTTTSSPGVTSSSPVTQSLKAKQRGKPSETYVALIAKALMSSPNGRMTLTSIYDYIIDNYEFYRTTTLLWRNAVRHNLSINDCFIKAGRTEIGRGYYWAIHPSCIQDFKKGDFRRRTSRSKVQRSQKKNPAILPLSIQQALQYHDCASTLQYHNQQITSSLHHQSYHHVAPVVSSQQYQPQYCSTMSSVTY